MTRSKLEKYLDVLEALVDRPKKIDKIAYIAKIECHSVKQSLIFLMSNGLVEERSLRNGERIIYAITERGLSVFKTMRALRYLETFRASLPIVEEAREISTIINEPPFRTPEE